MPKAVSLRTIGNWDKTIGVTIGEAMGVAMDVIGMTGEKACRQALVFMAQSARKLTPSAKKNRRVMRDDNGKYVENYIQGRDDFQKIYQWMMAGNTGGDIGEGKIRGTWENAKRIGNQGLAKRSWLWGLGKLGARQTGSAIRGTSRVSSIRGETISGYIKEDKLSYITKIMPAGWERQVERSAGNKIMANARRKMERKFKREVGAKRGVKPSARALAAFFLAQAA